VAIAERCNGTAVREEDDLVLSMPSLRELRRREAEGA
jgi:hypothetical protein